MKTKLLASALFAATAATVAFYPAYDSIGAVTKPADPVPMILPAIDPGANGRPKIEVAFVLDTTGSMSGLIEAAKEKIWSIASSMAQAQPTPEIRMGLVAYRDRGDSYVTRVVDLSTDLDSMYATLMDFAADGGGDGPESVNEALHDAVHELSWSQDPKSYRVLFLVGDAPPHMDYQDDVKYPETIDAAGRKGIVVNTIQAGASPATAKEWKRVASLGQGKYFQVDQGGSAVAIATPFDDRLAALAEELDDTRLYYGSAEEKAKKAGKMAATEKLNAASSVTSRARRAAFNASEAGEANFAGEGELVEDVASGRVDLDAIDKEALPEPLKAMAPAAQAAVIEETAAKRQELKSEIQALAKQRDEYLKEQVEARGGARDSLDVKVYDAVREQASAVGLSYEAEAPAY